MEKAELAVIGGSGFENLFKEAEHVQLETPFGITPSISIGKIASKKVAFLQRHGPGHTFAPHRINYRANVYGLHELGVERVLATNAVGAINQDFKPGDFVIPNDFIDYTKSRCTTFYDQAPVTHVDLSQPYCPEMRKFLIQTARKQRLHVWNSGVLVCTEGPRLETPAEINMFRHLGCDVVGMTGFPEVALARELEMCYAAVCYVSNMAAGMQERLSFIDVSRISKQIVPKLEKLLIGTIGQLPLKRADTCSCARALLNARFE